jgi:hypothetical protein
MKKKKKKKEEEEVLESLQKEGGYQEVRTYETIYYI